MTANSASDMSLAQAIKLLFEIKLSQHEGLRNKVNSLARLDLIRVDTATKVQRSSRGITNDQLITLHNAVILHSLLPYPKNVEKVFNDQKYRHEVTELFRALLLDRRSIVDISLLKPEVIKFLEVLSGTASLRDTRLANPFQTLPQIVLAGSTDLIQAVLVQSCSLTNGDAMMVHYLKGDLAEAWQSAQSISSSNPHIQQFKALIERDYHAAEKFDQLLDLLK